MAKNEVIEILKKFLRLIKSEGIHVERAFLYGSYLAGTATDESDIDILIVTENADDDYSIGKIWNLTRKINTKIEPYLIGKDRFNSKEYSPLIEYVKQSGLEII